MRSRISRLLRRFFTSPAPPRRLKEEKNLILLGQLKHSQNMLMSEIVKDNLNLAEFKVFSQWGDDGIINFLVDYLDVDCNSFVEFGVEDYTESNSRFLLYRKNWRGLIIDGSQENIDVVINSDTYWRYDITALHDWISCDNIESLISDSGFAGEIGLLSIDVDGNDYWIWDKIKVISPIIVVVEYNALFGRDKPWTTIYDSQFHRSTAHYSNTFYGSSLTSLVDLGKKKGYSFVACNRNGNNAYFVRDDRIRDLRVKSANEGFVEARFRESRLQDGTLNFLPASDRFELLRGLKVYNTRTDQIEVI